MHARLLGESFKAGSGKICAILRYPKLDCKHKTLQALEAGLRSMCSPASMHAYIVSKRIWDDSLESAVPHRRARNVPQDPKPGCICRTCSPNCLQFGHAYPLVIM